MLAKNRQYSWRQFDSDIKKIGNLILKSKKEFDGVWGPQRGGLPMAVCLSHLLGVPFLAKPKSKKTLIVDDITDSGKTLEKHYRQKYFIITIFYHHRSKFAPNIWLREKKDKWVVFPWEYEK